MKRRAREICWLVVFCLGLSMTQAIGKPGSVKPAIDFTELDKLIPVELKEKNTPGTVIAVISGDQVIYQKAFGVANVETNAEMQTEMLFRLGSTTKMFTAAALLTLAEQNKIKMNEPISNRVKGLDARLGQVTPHHLLSNSAGIRDFAAPVMSNDDPSLGNMVRAWKDDVFFAHPGEIESYSSPGYWRSGFVVEG
jgi:CubicO group peptidase (beta-lactamase class C family)